MCHREPTEEELNRCIAEQRQCLPAWWDKEGYARRREPPSLKALRRCRDCQKVKAIAGEGACKACYRRRLRARKRADST